MALIWRDETAPTVASQGFSWDAWYAKNKERLSEKRAKRYKEDIAYREAAKLRSRLQRETKKVSAPGPHTVSFTEAAQDLGVTVWVLREWRRKNYFPEPHHRDGRLWFTPAQVHALKYLNDYFAQHGSRVTESTRSGLDDLVSLVYSNWS
jgi:hypothetical protein